MIWVEEPKTIWERNSWKQEDFLPVEGGWALRPDTWGIRVNLTGFHSTDLAMPQSGPGLPIIGAESPRLNFNAPV